LTQLFFEAVERFSSKGAALRYKQGGKWYDVTHQELARKVQHAAVGMWELGIDPGDKVGILSANRPEWAIADYACLTARCADVPIYPTIPGNQVSYILGDSEAVAVFVADHSQYLKIAEHRHELPDLRHVICFDGPIDGDGIITLQELCQRGAAAEGKYPNYRKDACDIDEEALATLIYTSGTTGAPKGVMTTHRNITSNVISALRVLDIGPEDSVLSLLPLSHTFERTAGHYVMLHCGATISYAESIDKVPANLLEVRPTVVLSVPRLFEKIYARVLENATAGNGLKRRIFFWSRSTAEIWADLALADNPIPRSLKLKKSVSDRLVFSKLRARTGGRIRFFVSGGAPLYPEIARFFYAAGIPILEGYGITETSPVIAVNPLQAPHIGTVGPVIPGVEVKIAPDGEILARGPNVMAGYYNKPEETKEAIDDDGWFHTGDIGEFDCDKYLKITDRKKDIIVTAGGKNIAPQPIENAVKANSYVLNAVMVGDKRKFPLILVVPNLDALELWATKEGILTNPDEFLRHPDIVTKVEAEVMSCFGELASYEIPKKVLIVEKDFSIEGGELTPTLKVKRQVVEENYKHKIDAFYQE
jgi:long-chain acyl-CoA synthetase